MYKLKLWDLDGFVKVISSNDRNYLRSIGVEFAGLEYGNNYTIISSAAYYRELRGAA